MGAKSNPKKCSWAVKSRVVGILQPHYQPHQPLMSTKTLHVGPSGCIFGDSHGRLRWYSILGSEITTCNIYHFVLYMYIYRTRFISYVVWNVHGAFLSCPVCIKVHLSCSICFGFVCFFFFCQAHARPVQMRNTQSGLVLPHIVTCVRSAQNFEEEKKQVPLYPRMLNICPMNNLSKSRHILEKRHWHPQFATMWGHRREAPLDFG